MGELRPDDSQEYSEQKTEPFSQSEIDSRMQSIRVEELNGSVQSNVPLDDLVVPPDKDIRILMRPLRGHRSVSPGHGDSCKWLALRAEVAENDQPDQKVLAVTQTPRDIKFTVRIQGERREDESPGPPLWCELYYDPASNNQILYNMSDVPFDLSRISQDPSSSPGGDYILNPRTVKALSPGTWRIKVKGTEVLDFRILEKRPTTLRLPSSSSSGGSILSDMINSSGKRSFIADEDDPLSPEKKLRGVTAAARNRDAVIEFMPPRADPIVFPLPTEGKGGEIITSNGHALLDMESDTTVEIPGGCELEQYRITKRKPIASTSLSTVFTAEHSHVTNRAITVKVLKTRSPAANGALAKPQENERNLIRQADIWLREFESQEDLDHQSIVRLYGGDARFLSLYMEHVDARDLSAGGVWRHQKTDQFLGDRNDATRILCDIAGALHYVHSNLNPRVHNDIKPANILYSRERGAVLCDFGLSTPSSHPASSGGTPYYVPPEFIGGRQRGAPSDVWALGITGLYVLGKIGYPDARGRSTHPRKLYWRIAEVNQRGGTARPGGVASAISQMQTWLSEINEVRSRLNLSDKLEKLVYDMLVPQPTHRITMRKVMIALSPEL